MVEDALSIVSTFLVPDTPSHIPDAATPKHVADVKAGGSLS